MLVPGKFSRAQTLLAVAMVQGKRGIRAWCGQKNVCSSVPEYATGSAVRTRAVGSHRVARGHRGRRVLAASRRGKVYQRHNHHRQWRRALWRIASLCHVHCLGKRGENMHRLRVIFPAARTVYPEKEVALRTATLRTFCGPHTHLEFGYPTEAEPFKQHLTWADFLKAIPFFVTAAQEAEADGCDAIMIHCVYDPGYDEMRRAVKIPVVGFGQAVFHAATQIAPRFGLIAPNDALTKEANAVMDQYRVRDRLAPMEPLNIELPEAHKRREELRQRSVAIARHCQEKGAGVVIPFGMALIPTHVRTEDLRDGAGIPVLNPAQIGIREAELILEAVA